MLVSIYSDDFNARIGQEIEVEAKLAHELIQNEQAEAMDAIKLPKSPKPKTMLAKAKGGD